MDVKNLNHSRTTYNLVRLEHVAIVAFFSVATLINYDKVDWAAFIAVFVVIDLIGYLPGAIVFRKKGRETPKIYYILYNTMHSYLLAFFILGVWAYYAGGFEWAMTAFPIHLSGDRGVFGNIYKPFSHSFEPQDPV